MGAFVSVIVPTIGRPSLEAALASIAAQPGCRDVEIVIVADVHERRVDLPPVDRLRRRVGKVQLLSVDAGFRAWGHPQRNVGMQAATGDWLAFLDDDDVWTPQALPSIHRAVDGSDARVHLFRMDYPDGSSLWSSRVVKLGNVGTPMIVAANDPNLLGGWGDRYEGDYDFIRSTVDHLADGDGGVNWCPETICRIRPRGAR